MKRKKKILLIICLLLAIVLITVFLVFRNAEKRDANNNSQKQNQTEEIVLPDDVEDVETEDSTTGFQINAGTENNSLSVANNKTKKSKEESKDQKQKHNFIDISDFKWGHSNPVIIGGGGKKPNTYKLGPNELEWDVI